MADFIHNGEEIPVAPVKDPDSTVSYGSDWSSELEDGEAITESTWILPDELTEVESEILGSMTKIKLSGGIVFDDCLVTNRIVTNRRIDERSMIIPIRNK